MRSPARTGTVVEFVRRLDCPDVATLTALRAELNRWLAALPVPDAVRADVLLAVYEAAANATEHAYPAAPGPVDLHVICDGNQQRLTVRVRDHGRWHLSTATPDSPRGHGLVLIEALSTESALHVDATGTTVTMRWDLPSTFPGGTA